MTSRTKSTIKLLFVYALLLLGCFLAVCLYSQTPSCVGKHTAREQCECLGQDYDPTLKPVPGCVMRKALSFITTEDGWNMGVWDASADPCGLPAVISADGRHCVQTYTVTKPASKAVCVYADHGSTATIKCTWKLKGK